MQSPAGVALPQSPVTNQVPSSPGTGLELTLDSQLQYESEQALASAIESSNSVSGTAVVMDVKTGQILSMANLVATHPTAIGSPTTDDPDRRGWRRADRAERRRRRGAEQPRRDPALRAGLGVQARHVLGRPPERPHQPQLASSPSPTSSCWTGRLFHDAEPHPTEQLTATQILAQSSNIGTGLIAQGVGEQRLLDQVKALGFGQSTGLDFPGESPGLLATAAQWEPTDYVSLPIGQVDAVSALQVLDAYNTVANGGVYVAPKLVQANGQPVGDADQDRPFRHPPGLHAFGRLRAVHHAASRSSTWAPGPAPPFPATRWPARPGPPRSPRPATTPTSTGAYMASFVGYAPAANPTLSMIVVLDRPTPIFGGTVAAPVFSQIMSYALHRYDIPTTPGAQAPTTTTPGTTPTSTSDQAQDIT